MFSVQIDHNNRIPWKWIIIAMLFATWDIVVTTNTNAQEDFSYRLTLNSGDVVVGKPAVPTANLAAEESRGSGDPVEIAWQHPSFNEPLRFPFAIVEQVEGLADNQQRKPRGRYRFSLRNGDSIFGNITGIQDGNWLIDTELFGAVTISQDILLTMEPWRDGQADRFRGPGHLEQWSQRGELGNWSEDAGALRTDRPISSIFRDVALTPSCRIDLEISWEGRPNFVIVIGTDERGSRIDNAVRIEVWDSVFTFIRETSEEAEIISIGTVDSYAGRARWSIDIDPSSGFAILNSIEPAISAQLELDKTKNLEAGISFENIEGSLSIDSLEVFESAKFVDGPGTENNQYKLQNGQIVFGEIDSIEAGEIVVTDRDSTNTNSNIIQIDQLEAIRFSEKNSDKKNNQKDLNSSETAVISHASSLIAIDGSRVTGAVTSIDDEQIYFRPAYSDKVWRIFFDSLHSLQNLDSHQAFNEDSSLRYGRLILDNAILQVALRDAKSEGSVSCFRLAVKGATNEVSLNNFVSGLLTFDTDIRSKGTQKRKRGLLGSVVSAIAGTGKEKRSGRGLYLRNGDSIPGTLVAIDGNEVLFDSVLTGKIRIPHQEIKAVDFNSLETVLELDDEKKRRLLTVPRLRRKSPPQHLLISNDGDYLIGTVVGLDEQMIRVTKGLEELEIPRRFLSKMIWFHEDELDFEPGQDGKTESETEVEPKQNTQVPSSPFLVQAVQGDGIRLTFHPEQVGGDELIGSSPLLGSCLIDLSTVDQLIFGAAAQTESSNQAFQQWRLQHALLPRVFAEESEAEMASVGQDHVLVGQEAPEIRLGKLQGGEFQLSEYRGQIVILDFWATWCGPCIRSMPKVVSAVRANRAEEIQLVAVNLQESPDQIRPALERMGIDPLVVLDIDGVVAARYEATAIPQTVLIDREGIVRRVYVGAGGNLEEQLKLAIEQVLSQTP